MTIITLPRDYWIEIDGIRNYTLKKKYTVFTKDKKTKDAVKVLGYYSDFVNAVELGYIKDIEANNIEPNELNLIEYAKAVGQIEKDLVEEFKKIASVKFTQEETEYIL